MSKRPLVGNFTHKVPIAPVKRVHLAINSIAQSKALPFGTRLRAGPLNALAQPSNSVLDKALRPMVVADKAKAPEGKDAWRATQTTITAGISCQAAQGGEEVIKLRGYSLAATGDIFVDGMRDPALCKRDTFSLDRMEALRGSASMLFGPGCTGGAVNLVNKMARLLGEHQMDVTLCSHKHRRVVIDFNLKTSENAGLRLNAMSTTSDNNGAGSSIDKKGVAAAYRWGIGERNEFSVDLYHPDNNNGVHYGMPWIRPTATAAAMATTVLPLEPMAYYGTASDVSAATASCGTVSHLHRFDGGAELQTKVRRSAYTRDQRASTIRLCQGATNATTGVFTANAGCPTVVNAKLGNFSDRTVLTRSTQLKIQDLNTLYAQSDFRDKFQALGLRHEVLAGVDVAQEKKVVYGARTAAQRGVNLVKPNTTVGTPINGALVDEASRVRRTTSNYTSTGWGTYMQDLVQVAPHWKVLAGMRFDQLVGDYTTYALSAANLASQASDQMRVPELSKRVGMLYQPDGLHAYHLSEASFNTSGAAYSPGATNVNTPPEQSINIKLGAKLDSAGQLYSGHYVPGAGRLFQLTASMKF